MKKIERLLIWGFILGCLAIIAYFSFKIAGWNEQEEQREIIPGPPVARVIQIDFHGPDDLKNWNRHNFHGEASFEIQDEPDGTKSLKAASRKTSSAIFKPVAVPIADHPFFSWEWKVTKFPSGKKNEKFAAKEESDFAARVSVIFKSELPLQQDIVQYVWDDHFPAGTRGENASWKKIKILVVRSGPSPPPGPWASEKRDVAEDYRLLFGKAPQKDIEAIGVMTDSDDTQSETEAYFRKFKIETLHAEEGEGEAVKTPLRARLAPVLKKTRAFFRALMKPAQQIPKVVVSTTGKIPKAVVSTTKRVIEPVARRMEAK